MQLPEELLTLLWVPTVICLPFLVFCYLKYYLNITLCKLSLLISYLKKNRLPF